MYSKFFLIQQNYSKSWTALEVGRRVLQWQTRTTLDESRFGIACLKRKPVLFQGQQLWYEIHPICNIISFAKVCASQYSHWKCLVYFYYCEVHCTFISKSEIVDSLDRKFVLFFYAGLIWLNFFYPDSEY